MSVRVYDYTEKILIVRNNNKDATFYDKIKSAWRIDNFNVTFTYDSADIFTEKTSDFLIPKEVSPVDLLILLNTLTYIAPSEVPLDCCEQTAVNTTNLDVLLSTRLSESDFDTKTGSLTETAPATDTSSSGLNGRLQRIAQRITSLIALLPTSLGQKTMVNSLPVVIASDQSSIPVRQGQVVDAGNTAVRTVTDGATQFVGTWGLTRSLGYVRQLTVLASTVPTGLGGTFIFEYSEDGITATISESRVITDFATVRDFDLLNAGAYYRIKFTPSRALVGAELVFINTTQRLQNDGAFVRLANQEIEEANAAMGNTFAYQKNFDLFTGKSENVRSDAYAPALTTTALLGIGGVWNSGIVDARPFNYISGNIKSDVDGSMTVYFYNDLAGTVLLRQFTRPYVGGTGLKIAGSILTGKFVKYIYTNGAVAQTDFYTDGKFYKSSLTGQILGLEDFVPNNIIVPMTRAIIAGSNPLGVYNNVNLGDANELQIAKYGTEVVRGNLLGKSNVRVEARNGAVNTTEQIIWGGGVPFNFLLAATQVRIRAGGNVADTAAGTGARSITLTALDDTGMRVTENLATNGILASSLSVGSFRRVQRFFVADAGLYALGVLGTGSNVGAITLETSAGLLLGSFEANTGTSAIAVYTVPVDKKGYFTRIRLTPEGGKAITFRLWTRKQFDKIAAPFTPKVLRAEWVAITTTDAFILDFPIELDSKEEAWVTAKNNNRQWSGFLCF